MGRREFERSAWAVVLARSLVVGAASGLLGGALIFFSFGFIGFAGASVTTRVRNGWDAVVDTGISKGLVVGLGLAFALALTTMLWGFFSHIDPRTIRPGLSVVAGLIVVAYNLESLRNSRGWDVAGIATVLGMALLVTVIVWVVTPWVLRERRS